MSMFRIFDISGSAVSAQSQRLNVVASNLANADTVAGPDGQAYKARQVMFRTTLMGARMGVESAGIGSPMALPGAGEQGSAGVTVSNITEDNTPGRKVHDPKHPNADADGMVTYSNVNPIEEMVNMISASRSYQNNIEVMTTAKTLLQRTLQMGQS
jgi:flagellar basal-body rod protein FlgC